MFRVLLLLFVLYGCSAQYHLNKAIKKGYTCEQTGDTIRITTLDSIPVIINDTIEWTKFITTKDTIIKYNTVYVPKTRQEKRIEYRLKVKTIYKDRIIQKAQAKADGKKNKPKTNLFWLGILVGSLLSIIISLLWKVFIKKALYL
jgi:hypothetical protein